MKQSNGGIIGWFAQNPVAANLLMFCVIVAGIMTANDIRKESFPSMEPRFVTVSMTYDSGDAKQAEEGIAINIENALESVPGIKRMTSTSSASGSSVQIEKQTDYDLDTLMTDVKNAVDEIYNFPSDAESPVISKGRREEHVIWAQLYGDADHATLQQLGEQLERELLAQEGISKVNPSSYVDHMMSIEIDEVRLQAYGLTITDVSNAINAESSTALTTSLRNKEKVIRLKASEQAYYSADFANIPLLANDSGTYLTVGDVTNIDDMFADDSYFMSRYNGSNGYGIQIVMDEYGDVENIVKHANALVDAWYEKGILPHGVQLETWYDRSTLITERLDLLTTNAMTGIAFVFVVLAIFLNLTVAFWVAAGLPFILFGTLYFMGDSFAGLTLNEMTTFGFIMALGIVVDDAVVVGESVYTTRQKYGDTLHNTILGTLKVAVPTLFGVFTTVAAFAALSNISGFLGSLFAQFGLVVTICLVLSIIETKFILPAHLSHLSTQPKPAKGFTKLWAKVQNGTTYCLRWFSVKMYRPALRYALNLRYAVVILFFAIFVSVIGLPMNGIVRVGFFPSIQGDTVRATMSLQSDASYGQTERNMAWLEQTLNEADQQLVSQYGAHGSGIGSLQVTATSDQSGAIVVELNDDKVYSLDELARVWRELAGIPEATKQLKIRSRREMVDAFKVELKSVSDETLLLAEEAFNQRLNEIDGVTSVESSLTPGEAMMRFELTPQGRALGLNTASLSRQLLQAFGGDIVQRYLRNKNEVKVRVRYPKDSRTNPADVLNARVRLDDGTIVPLSVVARIVQDTQQKQITRIDGLRALTVAATIDSDIITASELVSQLASTLVPELSAQHSDLSIYFAGEAEQQAETSNSMLTLTFMALFAIFALLAIPLKSYVQPMIIMAAIPFGVVGAILGHWSNGLTLSLLSIQGILALSGVVVNDSLLLVSRYNELRGKGLAVKAAILEACSSRLRAILLTSVTTFAGLYPILGETSKQAQFLIPAAVSLGYGILFATVITLLLIPALILINEDAKGLYTKAKVQVSGAKKNFIHDQTATR